MPYERYATGDKRKVPFRTTSKDAQYEGFFLIGQQYAFNAAAGFGFDSTKKINGTEEYKDKPLIYVDQVARFSEKPNGRWAEGSQVLTGEENSGVRLMKFPGSPCRRSCSSSIPLLKSGWQRSTMRWQSAGTVRG